MRRIYVNNDNNKHGEITIQSAFVQVYISAFKIISQLKYQCSLYLLEWIIVEMNGFNQIHINKGNRSEFLVAMKKGGKNYSDESVRKALRELIEVEMLLSMSDEGKRESCYLVNPKYYWKTKSQKDRIETIQAFHNLIKTKENERDFIRSESKGIDVIRSREAQQGS